MKRRFYLDETFDPAGWRAELDVIYRQRKSVIFVLAALVVMSVFWDNPWAWVVYFGVMAAYAAINGVRIGVICALSFCFWFVVGIKRWLDVTGWQYQALGLWCIGTLFFVIIWKADGVHRFHGREPRESTDQHRDA